MSIPPLPDPSKPAAAPGRRGRGRASRVAVFFLVAAVLLGYMFWPHVRLTWNNPAPTPLTLEDYLAHGSDSQWLILKNCYVSRSNKIDTDYIKNGQNADHQYTYYPLTSGPSDTRPAKVFVRPNGGADCGDQILLTRENESTIDVLNRAAATDKSALQEVTGVIAVGIDDSKDVKEILKKHGDSNPILLLHNVPPWSQSEAMAACLIPIVLGAVALWLLARRQSVRQG
jgi:hypothetical protein